NAIRIHFEMTDNPSLSQKVIERYKRMYSGVFYDRFIRGLWVLSEGIIYDNFDKDKMVKKPPENISASQYYVSIDYGTQNATVFLLWAKHGKQWYCIDEYYYSGRDSSRQKTDAEYSQELKSFLADRKATIIVDPSAASFIAELQKNGFKVIKAKNDVLDGIRATQTAMNQGEIYFTDRCKNLFIEFASYIWDEKAGERGEDKPIKQFDHACDALRYFVYTILNNRVAVIGNKAKIGL
ncbi:TPA: PBSX family phage terminase large subunit, partial [Enterococcus faecium]|nr:PBSX family phage terminase large subunit [Enterococcus faecium]